MTKQRRSSPTEFKWEAASLVLDQYTFVFYGTTMGPSSRLLMPSNAGLIF